jgi:Ino eighty subunit 1
LFISAPRPQYVSRKTLAIKRGDSEILTRNDVQYAFLYHVFNDKTLAFTDETPGKPSTKVNFCDLYVHALYNSAKCSKVMRDKMLETPAFAVEFAKISLLTNVGRINTTMACMCCRSLPKPHPSVEIHVISPVFPEMKTALRSYHPVPSLQKTDGNVQDAPRIKNCLKAAFLPGEQKSAPPSTPADILSRAVRIRISSDSGSINSPTFRKPGIFPRLVLST